MATKPTHLVYLVRDIGKKPADGKKKGNWQRIGAVFANKSGKGSTILWDYEPVPTNGRTYIMPYEERRVMTISIKRFRPTNNDRAH